MLDSPHSNLSRGLIVWFGLFQVGHLLLNGRYLLSSGDPPFKAPPEGWLPQTVSFLNGMAVADFLNTLLTLVFLYGYFRYRAWSAWLGTLTLALAVYATVVFLWGAVASGALHGVGKEYLWVTIPFMPVVLLFIVWCYWGATGRLGELGAPIQTRST